MERIFLDITTESTFDEYYQIRCSPSDIFWNGYISKPDKENFKKLYLKRLSSCPFNNIEDRKIYLVRISAENNKAIGFVQLIRRNKAIEIGYSIVEKYQGHGYATEALSKTLKIAFQYNLELIIKIRDDNIASQKVAKKNNFFPTDEYSLQNYPETGLVKLRIYRFLQ